MKVYLLIHETYTCSDNDFYFDIKTFQSKQSAMNYLKLLKECILEEILHSLKIKNIEELEYLFETTDIIYDYQNNNDHFFIDIYDEGSDCLRILEQDVMNFE